MDVACVGAGPGGLYLAILLKRQAPDAVVTVYERNPRGQACGWGIVYWADLLAQLRNADPESAERIAAASFRWTGQALTRDGREVRDHSAGGFGLGRRRLVEILDLRAAELGVEVRYETEIQTVSQLLAADLIVASDGAGSRIRAAMSDVFRPRIDTGRNKYIWLGVDRRFETFTFGMARTEAGRLWFHAYAYGETSTFIVECGPQTWMRLGFGRMSPAEGAEVISRIFARELEGRPLRVDGARWENFRTIRNATFVGPRTALLGDAAHTAHFAIGSGTQLALEDAISLAGALAREPTIGAALQAYDQARRPAVARAQALADRSAAWFEKIDRYAVLSDRAFFDLLLNRRSRLLARLPPRAAWWVHRASRGSPLLRTLRRQVARLHDRIRTPGATGDAAPARRVTPAPSSQIHEPLEVRTLRSSGDL